MAWWMYDKPVTPKAAQAEFVAKNSTSTGLTDKADSTNNTSSTDKTTNTTGNAVKSLPAVSTGGIFTNPTTGFFTNLKNAATAQSSPAGNTVTVNTGNQPYMEQLNALYDQIMNRKPFQYDLNGDLLYRQMADQYTQLGQQASRDAMGQAAALTGGYGNSYAQQVGNQTYQQYLTALNQNIPDLYDRAYQAYANEGDNLLQQYEIAAMHPEYLSAMKPQTYTVQQDSDDDNLTYMQYLQSMLSRGQVEQAAPNFDFTDYMKLFDK